MKDPGFCELNISEIYKWFGMQTRLDYNPCNGSGKGFEWNYSEFGVGIRGVD